jgi:hypothetical protein
MGGAEVRVLPNPGGLNAYCLFGELVRFFRELRDEAGGDR